MCEVNKIWNKAERFSLSLRSTKLVHGLRSVSLLHKFRKQIDQEQSQMSLSET